MKISELDEYKEKNPHLEQLVNGAPMIGDPFRLGRQKPKDNFRERLTQIKKDHPGSTINVWVQLFFINTLIATKTIGVLFGAEIWNYLHMV